MKFASRGEEMKWLRLGDGVQADSFRPQDGVQHVAGLRPRDGVKGVAGLRYVET